MAKWRWRTSYGRQRYSAEYLGVVERFVMWPVGSPSRLIAWISPGEDTRSRHLPRPSPSAPESSAPSPLSNSHAM